MRRGILIDAGLAGALALGLLVIVELITAFQRKLSPLQFIENKYLTWRDQLIAIEAFALLPPRRAQIVEWLGQNLELPAIPIIVVIAVAATSLELNTAGQWAAYLGLLIVAIFAFLVFSLQAQAFSRLAQKASWASPTRERFAEAQALTLPLALGISALVIYFVVPPAFRIVPEALANWYEHQETQRIAAFERSLDKLQFAPDQQAKWTTVRDEWITWSQEQADARVRTWRGASNESQHMIESMRWTLAVGLLGLLLAVALAEYLYASRPKGAISLVIWVGALVASEYLPDRIAQAVGVSEATVVGVILALALAAFIGVVGELGMAWRGRQQERVCPNPECFAVITGEANFCQNCSAPLN